MVDRKLACYNQHHVQLYWYILSVKQTTLMYIISQNVWKLTPENDQFHDANDFYCWQTSVECYFHNILGTD